MALRFDEGAHTNAVVYFMVTNLEYDVVKTDVSQTFMDAYISATMGEFGCWVDSEITKVVQAGVEHSFVPEYLGPHCEIRNCL